MRGVLVLWDVDLTLVRAGPLGSELYAAAFERATGQPLRVHTSRAGRLDPDIFGETLRANGIDPAGHPFERFAEALAVVYAARGAELRERGQALPGAERALTALAGIGHVVQTVLTGNVRRVAAIKLAAFGLDRHLDLDIGAYGPDAPTRAELVPLARRRAGLHDAVIVGDSRHDALAGRLAGARVVGVATGQDSAADLLQAGADIVLPDLRDTTAVLRAVLSTTRE